MTKAELESMLRNDLITRISEMIANELGTDALVISASEIAVPMLDAEQNEKFAVIKVSIPRGTRNGKGGYDEFDGYAAAEDYKLDCEEKAAKKAASEAKKAAKIKADQAKREAKKAIKELNKKGLDKMIHETDDPNQFLPNEIAV